MGRENAKIVDFLERVIELEKTVYVLEELENRLQSKIASLGKEQYIPETVEEHASFKECLGLSFLAGMFIGAIIGAIEGFVTEEGFFSVLINIVVSGIGGIISGGIAGLCLSPVWYIIGVVRAMSRQKEATEERLVKISNDQQRVRQELEQVKQLKNVLAEVRRKKTETQQLRSRFYASGPVYRDYQNFAAVCSFYQYFVSGKCSVLKGHEGAYVLYDYERKMDMVLEKLADIQRNLAQIQRNQYKLYTAIEDGNRRVDTLISQSVQQTRMLNASLEQNAIIAHNTDLVQKEMAFSNWLKTYELSKKGY